MTTSRPLDELTVELVQRATSGDATAVDEILTTLSRPFYNLAVRMLQHHHDAEDATQEALIRVATNLSSFRGESRFSTWAWTVATRCILDFRDGRARRALLSSEAFADDLADGMAPASSVDPETSAILGQVKLGCGRAMLQTLDGDLRVAYALGEILGLDQAEAAQALGISYSTYRKRLSRARSLLHAVLAESCGIVDDSNQCRCARRQERAIELGRLEPEDAVVLDIATLSERVNSLEGLSSVAAYFRADPMINTSQRLLPRVREVLNVS